ncbi:unnamed protein product [Clonostachys solani]|uniref:F-box domain-containing protein n=1 Tax=Clonostachys solani TaxID=160281 RepID=A0A9N9ZJT0_9HYPO|nr:unnamed protein product [Clonostachys solani]
MALTTLPLEVLHTICECLDSHREVARFRLVCRAFGDIGLKFLIPLVTVAPTAESIARLRAISLHPVLRHYVYGVSFLINVFWPDGKYGDWWPRVPTVCDLQGTEGLYYYKKMLSGQKNAFRALGPGQDVENACRRFPNLDLLDITEAENGGYLHKNQTYKSLREWLPKYNPREGQPFYPFNAACSYTGLPGVKPLKTFLRVMTSSKVRKLEIQVVDVGFFDGYETRDVSRMREGLCHLRDLVLCLCVNETVWWESVPVAKRILSNNRLRDFLCSAPHLEKIEISSNYAHKSTLKILTLTNCMLANDPDQGSEAPRSRWSDVFVPLVISDLLDSLALWGIFSISKLGDQDADSDADSDEEAAYEDAYIDMQGVLQDIKLTVAQAVAIVICSREFDSFLRGELAGRGDLEAEAVKKALVEDLTGEPQVESSWEKSKKHVKRYSNYLKSFAMHRDIPNWGAWWRRADGLPFY